MQISARIKKVKTVYLFGLVLALGVITFSVLFGALGVSKVHADPLAVVLVTSDGDQGTLKEALDGRPAIINTWASWCPYCAKEMPDFVQLQKEFPGVHIVAINRAEDQEVAEAYIHRVDPGRTLTYFFDPTDSWYKSTGGYVMPETVFLSTDGEISLHRRGVLSLDEMRGLAEKLQQVGLSKEDVGGEVAGCTGLSCRMEALDVP